MKKSLWISLIRWRVDLGCELFGVGCGLWVCRAEIVGCREGCEAGCGAGCGEERAVMKRL